MVRSKTVANSGSMAASTERDLGALMDLSMKRTDCSVLPVMGWMRSLKVPRFSPVLGFTHSTQAWYSSGLRS